MNKIDLFDVLIVIGLISLDSGLYLHFGLDVMLITTGILLLTAGIVGEIRK